MTSLDLAVAEALDPVLLGAQVGLDLDDWQARALREVLVARRDRLLLCCCRQSGKTTLLALAGLIEAMGSDATVLIVSASLRQSQEAFRTAARLFHRLTRRTVEPEAESALRISFDSGGRFIALPGGDPDTIRGYSCTLLLLDEAARIPDELYVACRPMVSVTRGRIIAASTPFGADGWFAEAWHGSEDWGRYLVPADRCPRLTPRILAAERDALGPWHYAAEYECVFATVGLAAWFDVGELARAVREDFEPWL